MITFNKLRAVILICAAIKTGGQPLLCSGTICGDSSDATLSDSSPLLSAASGGGRLSFSQLSIGGSPESAGDSPYVAFFKELDRLGHINSKNVSTRCDRFHKEFRPEKKVWWEQLMNYRRDAVRVRGEHDRPVDLWYSHVDHYLRSKFDANNSHLTPFERHKDDEPSFSATVKIPYSGKRGKGGRQATTSSTSYALTSGHTVDPIFPIKPRYWDLATEGHPHPPRLFPVDIVHLFRISIIGQDDALRVVARGLHGHFVRVAENERVREARLASGAPRSLADAPPVTERTRHRRAEGYSSHSSATVSAYSAAVPDPAFLSKSNLVVVGPTGSGKTATLSLIEEMFDVPVILVDGSRVTPEGWRGDDVSNWFKMLFLKAGGDIQRAQRGIICIDEFDKILGARSDHDPRGARGIAVQSELLKAVEGAEISIKPDEDSAEVKFDTRNIWWIAMGVFEGIEKSADGKVTHERLIRFGLTRELCSRFTNVCTFNPVDETALVRILQESRLSPLENAKRFLALDPYNIGLEIDEAGLNAIARSAFTHGNGSRSLQSIIDHLISPIIDDAHLYTDRTIKLAEREIDERLKSFLS
jgi:ATP-dependent Clp protease ATP-binding subunit ClpX